MWVGPTNRHRAELAIQRSRIFGTRSKHSFPFDGATPPSASLDTGSDLDWSLTISEPRLYTDEEVAMILREAAQSADSPAEIHASSSGLSLDQIKAAAAEVGLDPSLVERAALRVTPRDPESFLQRAAGGPLHHRATIHLATAMSEKTSARLLAAIRAAAEVPGEGRADASGFFWHAWYRANRLSVTATEDSQGTRVQVLLDRTAPMINTVLVSLLAIVMPIWMRIENPGLLALAALPIGVLAAARMYWKASTRSLRERIAMLLDAVRESPPTGGDGGSVKEPHA